MQRNAAESQPNRRATRLAGLLKGHGHTLCQIVAELNAAGYRTRRGQDFHATTVSRPLTRTVSASIPPIVLEDEVDQRLESVSGSN